MREYETTVIVQPEISSSGTEAILQRMDAVLDRASSTRLMCADLGKRKLAYEIQKFQKGHYYTLSFVDLGQVIPELERVLRMEESVLRFMTVLVDDDVSDLEARKQRARERELEQQKRAAEKAEREAEEARAREDIERRTAEDVERRAAEAATAGSDASDVSGVQAGAASESAGEAASAEIATDPEAEGSNAGDLPGAPEREDDKHPDSGEKS